MSKPVWDEASHGPVPDGMESYYDVVTAPTPFVLTGPAQVAAAATQVYLPSTSIADLSLFWDGVQGESDVTWDTPYIGEDMPLNWLVEPVTYDGEATALRFKRSVLTTLVPYVYWNLADPWDGGGDGLQVYHGQVLVDIAVDGDYDNARTLYCAADINPAGQTSTLVDPDWSSGSRRQTVIRAGDEIRPRTATLPYDLPLSGTTVGIDLFLSLIADDADFTPPA